MKGLYGGIILSDGGFTLMCRPRFLVRPVYKCTPIDYINHPVWSGQKRYGLISDLSTFAAQFNVKPINVQYDKTF